MMKSSRCLASLLLVMAVVMMVGVQVGQGQAALCDMTREGFAACKPAVTPPSPVTPSGACCSALSKANLHCLCSYKNSNLLPYMGVDPTLAMGLPAKCGLVPPSDC